MNARRSLPEAFLAKLRSLESSYLIEKDPIKQSGFGGGAKRWRAEREPILDAIEADGDLLDMGCANGYQLECLMAWGQEREITPHGLDQGEGLIQLARRRLPNFAANFHLGNAWDWQPPRRYHHVYTLCDCVPHDYLEEYLRRVLHQVVAPGGRLILGAYGNRSRDQSPLNTASFLRSLGFAVAGSTAGGDPPITSFAWMDRPLSSSTPEPAK